MTGVPVLGLRCVFPFVYDPWKVLALPACLAMILFSFGTGNDRCFVMELSRPIELVTTSAVRIKERIETYHNVRDKPPHPEDDTQKPSVPSCTLLPKKY
jgi:hypothetical protein